MAYCNRLVPDNGQPKHLLWMCYFLKCYSKQAPGCSVVGGTSGAADPKTMKKWVWEFIDSVGELVDEVEVLLHQHYMHYYYITTITTHILSYTLYVNHR